MRLLTFSTLYPNAIRPLHGIFVETRLRHLVAGGGIGARVVAPVPWFPADRPVFGRYAAYARVPRREHRHGLDVLHPRYPVLPKVGMTAAPWLLYRASLPVMTALADRGEGFDVIDAHYFYPDGVAAVMLGRKLGKPVTITARGTDLNLIADYPVPRRLILTAASRADGLITVCRALKDRLVALGIDESRVRVLGNGVDLDRFRPPGDRDALRARLGFGGPTILSVGHLIPRKGHDLVIGALPRLPGVTLVIAGSGPQETALRTLARTLGVADRVRFAGAVAHEEMPALYGAADALVLASSREGWANVLLEAMACGTPVAASAVWGTPEVVASPSAGLLLDERSADGVARAVLRLLADPPDRAATRRYAEGFDWNRTSAGQRALFHEILEQRNPQ